MEDSIDNHVYAEDILPQLPTNIADYIQGIFDERGNPSNHYEQWDIMEEIIEDSREPVYTYETNTTNSHFIPLEGVEVRANRWFTTYSGYTNASGNFTCDGTFDRPANYSIKWERYDFDIRDGSYGQAYYNGPKFEGDWNLNIEQSATPKSFLFAHIFRAAHTYYYKNSQWGIKTPPKRDGILGQRLHIAGKDETGQSHYFDFNHLWQAAEVVIFSSILNNIGGTYYYDSRDIFGTTIHELAHASHWEMGYTDVNWLLDSRLTESWATGIEWKITNDVYVTAFTTGNIYGNYHQNRTIDYIKNESDGYTPLVIDLIDPINQRVNLHGGNVAYPNDQVQGYSLGQIENALPGTFGNWWTWRDHIKDNYENNTESFVDYLFQNYK